MQAVFPREPRLNGKKQLSNNSFKLYRTVDIDNTLIYVLLSQTDRVVIDNKSINKELTNFVDDLSERLNGTITREDITGHNKDNGVYFAIKYYKEGIAKRINGATIYRDGHIYAWYIIDLPSKSSRDGLATFNSSSHHFKVQ